MKFRLKNGYTVTVINDENIPEDVCFKKAKIVARVLQDIDPKVEEHSKTEKPDEEKKKEPDAIQSNRALAAALEYSFGEIWSPNPKPYGTIKVESIDDVILFMQILLDQLVEEGKVSQAYEDKVLGILNNEIYPQRSNLINAVEYIKNIMLKSANNGVVSAKAYERPEERIAG